MMLAAKAFARLVGISERKGRRALEKCAAGGSWRGAKLEVRLTQSRGGKSGFSYEVALDSIPKQFLNASERPLNASSEADKTAGAAPTEPTADAPVSIQSTKPASPVVPPALPRSRVTGDVNEASWRLSIIQPVRQSTKPKSRARARALSQLAATPVKDRLGRPRKLAERTLRDWIARYDAYGLGGLMRKKPKNAGVRRVMLSRRWDDAVRAAGLSEADIRAAVEKVRKRVRGEWAAGTPSWPTVQLNALPMVIGLTREAGVALPDIALHPICEVPRRFIEAERKYAVVAMARKDAGRFAADLVPRVRRERSALKPCYYVAADVHHVDILYKDTDGRIVTPKAVAWLDLATNRSRMDFFIMPKGEMIRREHVIQSFIAMCTDTDWGVPTRLYVDNGGEYNWSEIADDLMKLKQSVDLRVGELPDPAECGTNHAAPNVPQSKVIEGFFSTIERVVFSQIPGYIAGERMRKKTHNVGRDPLPFPGDETALRAAFATGLAYYHVKPQSGHLDNASPNESFKRFVDAGWTATVLDPWELAVAFSQQMVRKVQAGGTISLSGTAYRADAIMGLVGQKVLVRQPMFGDRQTLFVFTEHGAPLAVAHPERVYAFCDPEGAGEQSRRNKVLARHVRELETDANPEAAGGLPAMRDVVNLFGDPARALPPDATVRVSPEYTAAAQMAKNAPARAAEETDRQQIMQAEKYERLARMRRAVGEG